MGSPKSVQRRRSRASNSAFESAKAAKAKGSKVSSKSGGGAVVSSPKGQDVNAATGRCWLKGDKVEAYYPIQGSPGWFDAEVVQLGFRSHLGHYYVRYEADNSEGWVEEVRARSRGTPYH